MMNIEDYIKISEESLKKTILLHPPQISEQDKNVIKEIVNVTRDFLEINQLFYVFLFNSLALEDTFILKYNDKLERIRYVEFDCDDFLLLNSLTINYISSGVTFVKSLEDYFKNNLDKEMCSIFKKEYISKKYDTCFSYRLFSLLRNYSQHGHLIVSCDLNGYCFDLNKIFNNPHFNYNNTMLTEINNIIKKFLYKVGDYPCIAFSRSIAEYKLCLSEIYLNFINLIEKDMLKKYKNFNTLLADKPEIIIKSNSVKFNDCIVYEVDAEKVHMAKIGKDLREVLYDIKNKVINIKSDDQKVFNEINRSFKKL